MEVRQNPEQPTFHKRPVSLRKTCRKWAIGEVMGVARSMTIRRRGATMQAAGLWYSTKILVSFSYSTASSGVRSMIWPVKAVLTGLRTDAALWRRFDLSVKFAAQTKAEIGRFPQMKAKAFGVPVTKALLGEANWLRSYADVECATSEKMPPSITPPPKTFYLNEQHELSRGERGGGGRFPQYLGIDWAAKGQRIKATLDSVQATLPARFRS